MYANSFVYEFDDSSINQTQDIKSPDRRTDIHYLHGMANCLECSGIKFILLLLRRN